MTDDLTLTYPKPSATQPKFPDSHTPFFIGVAGGAASGKKQVCQMIMNKLTENSCLPLEKVVILRMNDFYRPLAPGLDLVDYNFDHPDAFDFDLLEECISSLRNGKPFQMPRYDFSKRQRVQGDETTVLDKPDVVILEGILMLYKRSVRESLSLKVFVDVDSDVRLARQVVRDTEQFSRPLESVLRQYVKYVKPSFEDFIFPSKKYADVIIPRGPENEVAINLLTHHIVDILSERNEGVARDLRSRLKGKSNSALLEDEEVSDIFSEMQS